MTPLHKLLFLGWLYDKIGYTAIGTELLFMMNGSVPFNQQRLAGQKFKQPTDLTTEQLWGLLLVYMGINRSKGGFLFYAIKENPDNIPSDIITDWNSYFDLFNQTLESLGVEPVKTHPRHLAHVQALMPQPTNTP